MATPLLSEREHSVGEMLPRLGVEVSRVLYSLSSPQVAVQLAVARRILTTLLADQQQVLKRPTSNGLTMGLLRKIIRTGRVAEPAPPAPAVQVAGGSTGSAPLASSVQLRHVDAGSCNGCELEIASAFGPVYDAERYGLRLVASPRHADALLVTGPVTRNMADPLRKTYEAVPAPKRVIAVGDCALNCGVFAGGHGVEGAVGDIVPVDVQVPGCPPTPQALIEALRGLTGR